jgi:tripartite-type tricarboxylate transporter receptor subunit TctC
MKKRTLISRVTASASRATLRATLGAVLGAFLVAFVGALTSMLIASPAHAQADYPNKTITIIVAYSPGGNADNRARQLAQELSKILGKSVIVENKPGAGGNIGTEFVARAVPDGYTLLIANFAPFAVNQTLFKKINYNPQADFASIGLIEKGPLVLMVPVKAPYKTVKDVVDAAKAKPGALTIGNGGIGGSHHLSAEIFKQNAGIDLITVSYKGGAQAATDLLGGNIDMMFEQMYAAAPSIDSGRLRPLAVTSATRLPRFPQVPTMMELGYKNVEVQNWQGLVAPKGTPKAIIDKLNAALNTALKTPDLREKIVGQNNELGGGSPEDFSNLIRAEAAKWAPIIKAANIKPE